MPPRVFRVGLWPFFVLGSLSWALSLHVSQSWLGNSAQLLQVWCLLGLVTVATMFLINVIWIYSQRYHRSLYWEQGLLVLYGLLRLQPQDREQSLLAGRMLQALVRLDKQLPEGIPAAIDAAVQAMQAGPADIAALEAATQVRAALAALVQNRQPERDILWVHGQRRRPRVGLLSIPGSTRMGCLFLVAAFGGLGTLAAFGLELGWLFPMSPERYVHRLLVEIAAGLSLGVIALRTLSLFNRRAVSGHFRTIVVTAHSNERDNHLRRMELLMAFSAYGDVVPLPAAGRSPPTPQAPQTSPDATSHDAGAATRPAPVCSEALADVLDCCCLAADLVVIDAEALSDSPDLERVVARQLGKDRVWVVSDAPAESAALSTAICWPGLSASALFQLLRALGEARLSFLTRGPERFLSNMWINEYRLALAAVLAGIVLLMFPEARGVAVYFIVSGVLALFPYFIGVWRRSAVSRKVYRCPRAPSFSRFLTFHVLHSFWLDAFATACGAAVVLAPAYSLSFWFSLLLAPVLTICNRSFLANGVLTLAKWAVDFRFRIIIFRRNTARHAEINRRVVMPICGAYGQLIAIQDRSLAQAKPSDNADSEAILGEPWALIETRPNDDGWKDRVLEELSFADLAVFHWQGEVTANMLWEYYQASARLPTDRLVIVCGESNQQEVRRLVGSPLPKLADLLIAAGFMDVGSPVRSPASVGTGHEFATSPPANQQVTLLALADDHAESDCYRTLRRELHAVMKGLRHCERAS